MKPFNLEEYLANPNKKLVTRDGLNARIICTDKKGTDFPIIVLVDFGDKEETCYYTENGYWDTTEVENAKDIFFAPEKHEGWVNIFKSNNFYYTENELVHNSKEEAEIQGRNYMSYIDTIKIEWEE